MDLTKITMPFGLLDEATQDALRKWPHGLELYTEGGWEEVPGIGFKSSVHRARPAPRVPREFWISKHTYNGQRAVSNANPFYSPDQWIHIREVMEGEAQ